MPQMLAMLSLTSFASGTLVTYWADRQPAARAQFELYGGLLLVFGLVLIGSGLPVFRT